MSRGELVIVTLLVVMVAFVLGITFGVELHAFAREIGDHLGQVGQ